MSSGRGARHRLPNASWIHPVDPTAAIADRQHAQSCQHHIPMYTSLVHGLSGVVEYSPYKVATAEVEQRRLRDLDSL